MFNLELIGDKAHLWEHKNGCYFTGYFFDEDNRLLSGHNAIDYFLGSIDNSISGRFNGIYTFIKVEKDRVIILTDNINYFPVFYYKQNNCWIISDSWDLLVDKKGSFIPNKKTETEFLNIGFVIDNETLDIEILKTRAGEKLILNSNGKIERIPVYYFLTEKYMDGDYEDLFSSAVFAFKEAGKRLIKFLNNRTAVLPLSGGFDSRLIASLLKQNNYEKVICFTYGRKTAEVETSRKIAKALGYEWHFINYSDIETDVYLNEEVFKSYLSYAGNGYTMPFLQEYFAVKKLSEENIIPHDSVFLPGHVGDNLGGSYILKSVKTTKYGRKLFKDMVNTYFYFRKKSGIEKENLIERIEKTFGQYSSELTIPEFYNPLIEDWSVKEKFSKFLFHSSKVFNFFGYKTYFVLWDKKIIELFRKIPFKYREGKYLYDNVAIEEFFRPLNIYYNEIENKKNYSELKIQKVKDRIRYFFPWRFVLKRMIENDWMNYYPLTLTMENELHKNGKPFSKKFKSFNALISRWYLFSIGFYDK